MGDGRFDDLKPAYKTGTIRLDASTQLVTILHLTSGGAMVDAAEAVPEDAELVFDCPDTGEISARVTWVLGKRCGLTFDHVIEVHDDGDFAA